jgi:hypothetical protein
MFERLIEKATASFRKADPRQSTRGVYSSLAGWPESEAHLALLGHFLKARSTNCYLENWAAALKKSPKDVVSRFIRQGMLEPVSLTETVAGGNTVAELKLLLKQRALKMSGKKEALAKRLVEHDEAAMRKLHRDKTIVTCATHLRARASQYLEEKAKDRTDTIDATLDALRARDFALASRMIAAYEARQLNLQAPNPMAIPGPERTTAGDIEDLNVIFGLKPKALGCLSAENWEAMHCVAGVSHLLGGGISAEWLPYDFTCPAHLDRQTAILMMKFVFKHVRDKQRLRGIGVKKATYVCVEAGACGACLELSGKVFTLDSFPELPNGECTCDRGCLCMMRAVIPGF